MVRFGMKFSVGPLTVEWGDDGFRSLEWRGARRWELWSLGRGWTLDNERSEAFREARGW